jgi:tRNA pseudouridine55 synthase
MARRRKGREVSGILVLDKPSGMTSNGALQQAKRLFDAAKAGHTGSLDPLATGVLPICFGEATKFSQYVLDADKGYDATIRLGVGTDTLDAEGEEVSRADASHINREQVEAAIARLRGPLSQLPPMYSALKRDGQPLYKLARQGLEVERKPRAVVIHQLVCDDFRQGETAEADVSIGCSKGTYVRSLAESLGELLGVPAHVSALRRTEAGPYRLSGSITLEQLRVIAEQGEATLDSVLAPMDTPLMSLNRVELGESASFYLKQGQPVLVPNGPRDGMVRIYSGGDSFLGIGEMLEDGRVAPRRLVNH